MRPEQTLRQVRPERQKITEKCKRTIRQVRPGRQVYWDKFNQIYYKCTST